MSDYARNLDTYGDGGSDKDWPLCSACGGTGACYPCLGKGTVGPQNETRCPECHGNGLCVACGGMGQDMTSCLRLQVAVALAYVITVLLYLSIQVAAALDGWTEDETP
jgi:hypothetical protein